MYENDGDGDFKLHVNLRCKVAAMQLAARQPLQVDTLDARSLMQQVERARGALALEAKAAALAAGSRVVSAGRAAQSLDRARRDAPDIAGTLDNVKCSMPLTLAGATGVATGAQSPTEPKVKFTSNCYCNGDEVDCASMTPCKCAPLAVATRLVSSISVLSTKGRRGRAPLSIAVHRPLARANVDIMIDSHLQGQGYVGVHQPRRGHISAVGSRARGLHGPLARVPRHHRLRGVRLRRQDDLRDGGPRQSKGATRLAYRMHLPLANLQLWRRSRSPSRQPRVMLMPGLLCESLAITWAGAVDFECSSSHGAVCRGTVRGSRPGASPRWSTASRRPSP